MHLLPHHGLGLFRVKGFAEQTGGTARFINSSGKGFEVQLFLPAIAKDESELVSQNLTEKDGLAVEEQDPLKGKKILLIEDTPGVRQIIKKQLEVMGLEVHTEENGAQSIERLKTTNDFDLVVTDIVMPGPVQGTDVASFAAHHRPDLPVILVTGYAADDVVDWSNLPNNQKLLQKPVSREQLYRQVSEFLN